ncbi:LacI family DNA-binding transcriptional regulator [Nitratireductor basaltis]|uniref:Transcriptional regulator, LacI family protein n=1 Tax=Nitratireductor basaltis TaxID=472175 RepID=A0A084U6H7_9HYPH|nr:LacI family DNA-binding transcriptional regulator [Nitratireductor basaltis]KFB08563.1 Transcriptional regulator, LacI family protein [Nitratireductor basaltis]
MRKRKTLVDVAAAAGVSKMTASRALRGDKDVSKASIERVRAAAREIGYYGNHLAASLSSSRAELIGVVVPALANVVFPEVMSGVSDALRGTGFQPVFGVTEYDTEKEYEIIRSMLSWRPAGLIITGLEQTEATRKLLSGADIPIVQTMDCDGEPLDACVGFSHSKAGYDIAKALLATGRRRIGYAGCNLDKDTRAAKRRQGFLRALADSGVPLAGEVTASGLSSIQSGRKLAEEILKRYPDLDCIYFSNDDLAAGGICYCLETGMAVPEQIALAGFNGLDIIEGFPGRIATSKTARHAIGQAAAGIILEAVKGNGSTGGQRIILEPTISLGALQKA